MTSGLSVEEHFEHLCLVIFEHFSGRYGFPEDQPTEMVLLGSSSKTMTLVRELDPNPNYAGFEGAIGFRRINAHEKHFLIFEKIPNEQDFCRPLLDVTIRTDEPEASISYFSPPGFEFGTRAGQFVQKAMNWIGEIAKPHQREIVHRS